MKVSSSFSFNFVVSPIYLYLLSCLSLRGWISDLIDVDPDADGSDVSRLSFRTNPASSSYFKS
jgi:hypothetical protein